MNTLSSVVILYICTGKYSIFWSKFFESCQQYFLPGAEKHYYVFTDDQNIKSSEFVHTYFQSPKGFPMDSLLRFDIFEPVEEELKKSDYIFFFNSNIEFVAAVGEEILPGEQNEGLVGVLHPGYLHSSPFWLPFERLKKSTAYVGRGIKKYNYYLGGINGGTTPCYLRMIRTCRENIREDLIKGIIAFYHDESHINKYFSTRNILQLSPSYGYPEDWKLPFEPKILILNKMKHGGSYFDKLPSSSYLKRIRLFFKRFLSGVSWYF